MDIQDHPGVFDITPALAAVREAFGNPPIWNYCGDFWDANRALATHLIGIQPDPLLCIAMCNVETESGRVDHTVVIDKAIPLRRRCTDLCIGKIRLQQHRFVLHFSVYPYIKTVHLHAVSIGNDEQSIAALRGKKLVSSLFDRLAKLFRKHVSGYAIHTVALEQYPDRFGHGVVPHLMLKLFEARHAGVEDIDLVTSYVNVDHCDWGCIMLGKI